MFCCREKRLALLRALLDIWRQTLAIEARFVAKHTAGHSASVSPRGQMAVATCGGGDVDAQSGAPPKTSGSFSCPSQWQAVAPSAMPESPEWLADSLRPSTAG